MKNFAFLSAAALAAVSGLASSAFAQCASLSIGATPNAAEAGTANAGISGDDVTSAVSFPFSVSLYGGSFSGASVSSNGNIQFASSVTAWTNTCPLPSTTFLGGPTIMPFWDDLLTNSPGSGVFTSTSGAPGAQRFNIQWRATKFTGGAAVNFIVSFYEGQSYFDVFYVNMVDTGGSASIGVQADGALGSSQTTFSCNAAGIATSGTSVRYSCPATSGPSVSLALAPAAGPSGTVFVATAPVTVGLPASLITSVSLDAASVDGGTVILLDNGVAPDATANDGTYSANVTVGALAALGAQTLTVTATDALNRSGSGVGPFNVTPPPPQWDEAINGGGDAGDLPATAQIPTGTDPFGGLSGSLDTTADADLFRINVCNPTNFVASTANADTTIDTQLFLFNLDGTGVTFNDDVPDGFPGDATLQSRITGQFVAAAGEFFLAVSRYDNDPQDGANQALWIDTPFGVERAPDGAGAASPIASWTGGAFGTGTYVVNLSGTCFAGGGPSCDYDFNQDENVDLLDAQQMAQVFVGLISPGAGWLDGDLNGDENADLTDAQLLAAFVVTGQCNL